MTAELLEARPWSEIGLGDVMDGASLTRTAFYRHFADRRELLLAVLEDVGLRLDLVADAWERAAGDPAEPLSAALRDLADLFHRHGRLLRAIADAAAEDRGVAAVYRELGARLSASTAERITLEVAAGRSAVEDPEEVATALVWMNERYLLERFGQPPLGDPARAAAALLEVWSRTVCCR